MSNPTAYVLAALVAFAALGAATWRHLPSERRARRDWAADRARHKIRVPVFALRLWTRRKRREHARRYLPPDPAARKLSAEERAVLDALEEAFR